jgi:hypothetical protein
MGVYNLRQYVILNVRFYADVLKWLKQTGPGGGEALRGRKGCGGCLSEKEEG